MPENATEEKVLVDTSARKVETRKIASQGLSFSESPDKSGTVYVVFIDSKGELAYDDDFQLSTLVVNDTLGSGEIVRINAGTGRVILKSDNSGLISPFNLWNPNTGTTAGVGLLATAGADVASNFIGGVGFRRIDANNSFVAFRVLSNNTLTPATQAGGVLVGEGSSTGIKVHLPSVLNFSIGSGGSPAQRSGTVGTNTLQIFNGTAPVGTLTNGISLYSTSGELRVMDAAGNPTLLSPHDKNNNWIFDSYVGKGKNRTHLKVNMEKMVRFLNKYFGQDWIEEVAV